MTVAFDAYSASNGSAFDPVEFTHTPVGTPRGILVFIGAGNDIDVVAGVTYGGVAMTEVTGSPLVNASGETLRSTYCYFLGSSIPTGAQTVSVDMAGTIYSPQIGCISLTASADTEIQDIELIDSDSLENPSATLTLGGKASFCAIAFNSGAAAVGDITPLTSWTQRREADHGAQVYGLYTYDTVGTTDVAAGWTQAADDALAIAIAITEAVGGGAFSLALDSVAWSWSATAVSLEHGKEVVPATVAWSWAAQDVTFTKGKTLALASVGWSWAAQDVSLEHGKEIVPASALWSWTITDAALEHGWEIAPASVGWSWSSTDATFTHAIDKRLVLDSVAWSWSAQDVSLEHGKEFTADSVEWTWMVGDVTFTLAAAPSAPAAAQDGGAGSGRKRKRQEWKVIPLDEWLAIHHPEQSVEKQTEVIEELAATISEAPSAVTQEIARQITLETRRVDNLVSELRTQSRKVSGLTSLLEEIAEYRTALENAKHKALMAQRALREYDDEEAILTIIYHA